MKISKKWSGYFKVGDVYGSRKVISEELVVDTTRNFTVLTECRCGKTSYIRATALVDGKATACRSCSSFAGEWPIPSKFFSKFKHSARCRNIYFNINITDLLDVYKKQGGLCALTGEILTFLPENISNASLDRIDSTLGYIKGNIQLVTKEMNIMKHTMDEDRFISLCKQVAEHKS